MTNSTASRSNFRWYALAAMMLLIVTAAAITWSDVVEIRHEDRWLRTYLIGIVAAAMIGLWLLFLSGFRWYARLLLAALYVAVIGAAIWGAVAEIRPDGDFRFHVRWRWEVDPEEALEKHRQQQPRFVPSAKYDLSDVQTHDWPEYRGKNRDGVVQGPRLARDWKKQPPKLLWRQPCGLGWSSFAVVGDLAITIEQRRENEAIIAYDVPTGKEVWKHEYPTRFEEALGGIGPRATPTIAHGDVFSLGADGMLICLDGVSGKPKWSKNILEGNQNLTWGMSGSPLVVGDWVIVNPGNQKDASAFPALIALDRKTGDPVWKSGKTKAGYSSPMLATLDGVKQVILFDGKQVGGFELQSGKELWSYPWDRTTQDINVAQPLVLSDGRVFISSGYNVGCAMLQPKQNDGNWQVHAIYQRDNKPLRCKFTSPVSHGDHLYGLDEGFLACIPAAGGDPTWREGRYGHGQVLRWEDVLLVTTERGDLVMVAADPRQHRELGRIHVIDGYRCWNVPAMANGRIFVRNEREMACYDLRADQE